MRDKWWIWAATVIFAAIVGIIAGRKFFGGPGAPPPGDPIIVRPRPTNGYWVTIDGADPIKTPYGANNWLNANAYTYIEDFYARVDVTLQNGTVVRVKVPLKKLTAQYKHCAATTTTQCTQDSDCGGSDTCTTSTMTIERDASGPRHTLKWYLNATLLASHTESDTKIWRGEFCGRFVPHSLKVDFSYNNGEYHDIEIPEDEEAFVQANSE